MSLGFTINKEKNGVLLAYITNSISNINLRKLLKLVYLIDEKFMKSRGFPLTWFDYYAWEKGPVAPEIYEIKNGVFSDYVECFKNENEKNIVRASIQNKHQILKKTDIFSQFEMRIIDDIISKYKDKTADELSEITHEENSLWSTIIRESNVIFIDGKSDIPIPLTKLIEGNTEKEETYNEALEYMQFCNTI
jgi:uncharacterized phage-associated protein